MEYKVYVILYVPEVEQILELYIPTNKSVYQVIQLINRIVNETTNGIFELNQNLNLYNRRKSELYKKTDVIKDTDIRNGTELVLF